SAMPTSLNQATGLMAASAASALRQARHERTLFGNANSLVLSLSKDASLRWQSSRLFQHFLFVQDRHHPASTVHADALAVLDPLGGLAGAAHRRQAVFAGHDGHVAHRTADVAHRRADLLEDRAPGGIGHL